MSESNTQLAERPTSVKDYLALPSYRDRFHEVMGKRANQFMAAIVASSQLPGLKDAEPRSVIAAAMVAATLDLPVNPTLGQAHIVAYNDGQNGKVAQFQIGYKGLIQLALRSGQYKRLNAGPVSEGAFKGFDMVGEPILDFTKNDPSLPSAGYYCAFETLNGFLKVVYFSKEQAESHAKRFSRAYAKGYSTPWKSDFDSMATKTVIKAALGKWGLLSVEMQKAVVHDQGAQVDVDADVQYVDAEDKPADTEAKPVTDRPAPRSRATKGAAIVKENATVVDAEVTPVQQAAPSPEAVKLEVPATPEPSKPVTPVEPPKPADPAPEPAAQKQPRVFLQDGETITATVTVETIECVNISTAEGPKRSVKAKVKGEYNNDVRHVGAATGDVPNKPYAVGAVLELMLLGKKSAATSGPNFGKVLAWVSDAKLIKEAPAEEF